MFIRQLEVENSEADDLIAYYCQISLDEEKTIFSSDKDLTQLISEKVLIYSPNLKSYYRFGDNIKFKDCSIPHYNVMTFKILAGDTSDNIDGISLMGEKTLIKFFPEILDLKTSLTDILTKGELLLKEQKTNVVLGNLLSGKTKEGIMGDDFFKINKKKLYFDLTSYIYTSLKKNGIKYIDVLKVDTFDIKHKFFSARRALKLKHNDYGRNISIIMLN